MLRTGTRMRVCVPVKSGLFERCFQAFNAGAAADETMPNSGGDDDAISGTQFGRLVDIREDDFEYARGHIDNAMIVVAAHGLAGVRGSAPFVGCQPLFIHETGDD
jgi:hypothetical protein